MNKFAILTSIALCSVAGLSARSIVIDPGQLAEKLKVESYDNTLTLSGRGDVRDLMIVRSLPKSVECVDLSGISMQSLNAAKPTYMGLSNFKSNRLPSYIFFQAKAARIIFPRGINVIEDGAFAASEISEVVIPEGVTEIGDYAFYGCPNLKSVVLPATLQTIGKGAFGNCPKLSDISLSQTRVTSLPDRCFAGDYALVSIDADGILSIGSEVFSATGLTQLLLPQVTYLAPYALSGMDSLREVVINSSADFNQGTLMNNRMLVSIEGMPDDVPALFAANCTAFIPKNALINASAVGDYAFAGTSLPGEIYIGKHLTYISKDIFKDSAGLKEINAESLDGDIPDVDDDAFASLEPSQIKLKVTTESYGDWRKHPVWGQFDIYTKDIASSVEEIPVTEQISIAFADSELRILSPQPLKAAYIYDTSGTMIASLPTGETDTRFDVSAIPAGIYIVKAAAGDLTKSIKIVF